MLFKIIIIIIIINKNEIKIMITKIAFSFFFFFFLSSIGLKAIPFLHYLLSFNYFFNLQ